MSIIDDIENIIKAKSVTWTYAPIEPNRTPTGLTNDPILPDEHYMSVTMRSCKIPDLRDLFTKFYGTVQSYAEIQSGTGDIATFQTITTPGKLQDADPTNLDRTIVQDIPLLGPVPFTGGNFLIQIGLFALKEADLIGPYLNLLGTIAQTAGISFMSQAVNLATPILNGVSGIVQQSAGGLQIGLYKGFAEPETPIQGYYSVIAAPAGTIDTSNLAIDNGERLVYFDSRIEIDAPYLVFTIERFTARSDWRQIPDVKKAFAALLTAEQSADRNKITDAMTSFKVVVASCQDLLSDDRNTVINKVQTEVTALLNQLPNPHGSVLNLQSIHL